MTTWRTLSLYLSNRYPDFEKNKMAASKAQSRVQSEAESMLISLEKDKVRPMQVRYNTLNKFRRFNLHVLFLFLKF